MNWELHNVTGVTIKVFLTVVHSVPARLYNDASFLFHEACYNSKLSTIYITTVSMGWLIEIKCKVGI